MRRLRYLLAGLVLLLGAGLVAAWQLPRVLDWNRYRDTLAELASARLGREVRIAGQVSLSLLPEPVLTAGKVSVADAGGGVAVTVAELRLRVGLGPLLAGRLDVRDLVVRGLDIRVPWRPGGARQPAGAGLGPAVLAMPAPDWLAALSAHIEQGRVSIGRLVISDIDATLATSDATGSYVIAGSARLAGIGWHLTARLTRPGGDGAVGVDLTLDGQGKAKGLGATLSGQIARDGSMTGRVSGRGPDLSQLLPAPPVPFRAQGRVSLADGLAVADRLAGEIGGSPASGAVALRLDPAPRLDVAVTASRLDLDAWAPALLHAAAAGALGGLPVGIDLSAEAAQLAGGTLRRLRGAFDVENGAVLVREARAVLPGDAQLRLSGRLLPDAAGKGAVRFDGQGNFWAPALRTTLAWAVAAGEAPKPEAGKPQAGKPEAGKPEAGKPEAAKPAAPKPGAEPAPPLALRALRLSGHVTADAAGLAVDRMKGTLDGTALAGSLTLGFGAQPALGLKLALDRLDLDPWLPAGLPAPASLAARLGGVRLALQLAAGEALLHGVTLAPLSLDLALEPTRLTLRHASFALDGAEGSLSGTLLAGGRLADGRLELAAAHVAPLMALLPKWLPGALDPAAPGTLPLRWLLKAPIWLGPGRLQLQASGTLQALEVKLVSDLGDLRIEAQPTLDLAGAGWRWAGPLTLRHPGAPRLAAALGLLGAPSWLGDGSLSLVAQLVVEPGHVGLGDFMLTAGGLHATGTLDLATAGAVPALSGRISADTLPLPLLDPRAPEPLPLGLLAGWQASLQLDAARVVAGTAAVLEKARATLALQDGTLRLEGVSGQLAGGALALRASLDSQASPPVLALRGSLTGAVLSAPLLDQTLDLTGGTMDVQANLAASGYAPAALLASLSGTLGATVRGGALAGLDLQGVDAALEAERAAPHPPPPATLPATPPAAPTPAPAAAPPLADAALRKALDGGSMGFDRLDLAAGIAHGVVRLDRARIAAPSGSIELGGSVSLPDSAIDLRLELHPALKQRPGATSVAAPTLAVRLGGTLARPVRVPELSDLIRWRAELGP